jgi:hypothetical protein
MQRNNQAINFVSQLKLTALKSYINEFLTIEQLENNSDLTLLKKIKTDIAESESVGEVWCHLFENRLVNFYRTLMRDFMFGYLQIEPSADELSYQRKADQIHALHWLVKNIDTANTLSDSDTLLKLIDKCRSHFSDRYGKKEVGVWHQLAQSIEGRKYISNLFFNFFRSARYTYKEDDFQIQSKIDNTHTWFWLAEDVTLFIKTNWGELDVPVFTEPTKNLFTQ